MLEYIRKFIKKLDIKELNMNINLNFYYKILAVIINFLMIPIMLRYLSNEEYGLWLLILSITNWIYTFDVGIVNSLKSRIAEYLVKKKDRRIRRVISTSYILLGGISLLIFISSAVILKRIDLNKILNIYFIDKSNLLNLVLLNLGMVCLNFILSICNSVFIGFQKSYLMYLNNFLSQVLIFIFLIILSFYEKRSIFYLSFVYNGAISLSHLLLSIIFFKKREYIIPAIKFFSKYEIKHLLIIGGNIFFIQIAGLLIFSTDNIIISYFLGPDKVGEYVTVNKFFSISLILLSLVLTPLWTQATEAYYSKNYRWFLITIKRLNKIFYILFIFILLQIIFGKVIIKIWTVDKIIPSFIFLLLNGSTILLLEYSNIYSTILSGINEVKEMTYLAIFQAVLNLILSYIFVKYANLGINGVILATLFTMSTNIFILPKLLNKKLKRIDK